MTIKHYTGQMTKEELKNTKIRILSEVHSKAFQEMVCKVGVVHKGCSDAYDFSSYLYIDNEGISWGNSGDIFESSCDQEITWTPIDLSSAPEDATHFTKDLYLKKSESAPSGWSAKFIYGTDQFCDQDRLFSEIYKISDFIGKNMTTNLIDQVRALLPKDAEIAIAHDKINLFIDDYCFDIKSIEDINKIQSALNTLEEYKA